MNRVWFSPSAFLIGYCCGYAFVLAFNFPLFSYYPLHHQFSWGRGTLLNAGPAMAWYGLMSSALIVALTVSWLIPPRIVGKLGTAYLWSLPAAAMLVTVYLLRHFFF